MGPFKSSWGSDNHSYRQFQFAKLAQLLRGTAWLVLSEGFAKATRVATLVVLGVYLTSADYGTVMLALTCHELIRALNRTGIGAAIIKAPSASLSRTAANANSLQWLLYATLACLQYCIADSIAMFYHNAELAVLLQTMALTYFLYPLVTVKVFLLQRQQRMGVYALGNATAVAVDNLSCALFVVAGFGLASIAFAKLAAALVWVIYFGLAAPTSDNQKPSPGFAWHWPQQLQLLRFSLQVLTSEMLKLLRLQMDTLIAGRVLTPELFGLYSFAKSMGVGLGQSLNAAFQTGYYPYLCRQTQAPAQLLNSGLLLALCVSALFVLQALASPLYITWLFNNRWDAAIPLVALLCLSAAPALLADTAAITLRAAGQQRAEIFHHGFCVLLGLGVFVWLQPNTPWDFALTATGVSVIWLLTIPVDRYLLIAKQPEQASLRAL